MKTSRLLLGTVALCGLLLVPGIRHWAARLGAGPKADALASEAPTSTDVIHWVWTMPIQGFRAGALSPDGKYIGLVSNYAPGTDTEKLSLWRWQDRPDKPLWSRPEPGTSLVAVGADGETVLSWAHMSPAQPQVSLRKGSDGSQIAHPTLDGPIWDVQLSPDGQYGAVTTGAHGLYLFPLDGRAGYHHWTLDGIGNSVALTSNKTYLTAGTWDDSGVSCLTMNGSRVWQYPASGDASQRQALTNRVFETQLAKDGQHVLGVSYANAQQSDGTLYLWRSDGDGTPRWTYPLGVDTYFPKAQISADGRSVAVTYVRVISHGSQSLSERRLLVLDGSGKRLWEKGNLLFSPVLLALAPDGQRVTVSDGQKTLYNLNADGRITAIYKIKGGATIGQTATTPDGRYLLVSTSDGLLNLFQIG